MFGQYIGSFGPALLSSKTTSWSVFQRAVFPLWRSRKLPRSSFRTLSGPDNPPIPRRPQRWSLFDEMQANLDAHREPVINTGRRRRMCGRAPPHHSSGASKALKGASRDPRYQEIRLFPQTRP